MKLSNLAVIFIVIALPLLLILGYYISEVIIYGNWIAPIQSVFANTLQCIVGFIGSIPISISLRSAFKMRHIKTEI